MLGGPESLLQTHQVSPHPDVFQQLIGAAEGLQALWRGVVLAELAQLTDVAEEPQLLLHAVCGALDELHNEVQVVSPELVHR